MWWDRATSATLFSLIEKVNVTLAIHMARCIDLCTCISMNMLSHSAYFVSHVSLPSNCVVVSLISSLILWLYDTSSLWICSNHHRRALGFPSHSNQTTTGLFSQDWSTGTCITDFCTLLWRTLPYINQLPTCLTNVPMTSTPICHKLLNQFRLYVIFTNHKIALTWVLPNPPIVFLIVCSHLIMVNDSLKRFLRR